MMLIGTVQTNAYNVALLNGAMGDGSQLLQVDQSGLLYNNIMPLGKLRFFSLLSLNKNCIVKSFRQVAHFK
jgi:hypothetical protein